MRRVKKLDSLYVACAIVAKVDYFLTTDDFILKKAMLANKIKITDPIGFIRGGTGMITDTEIKTKGLQVLTQYLGNIEAERFIALI